MFRIRWILGLMVLAFLSGCVGDGPVKDVPSPLLDEPAKTDPLSVYVVNYPLQYFVERIGGEHVEVVFPAPVGVDPAYWTPPAETVAAYQGADLVLLHGAGYAKWVERVTLPLSRLVDTSADFEERLIPLVEKTIHSHGPEGEHSHRGTAFTTWLDPSLAIEHARAVATALTKSRPDQKEDFQIGLESLEVDLQALDERLATLSAVFGDEPLVFSHPVYQYLVRRYSLIGHSLHWEPHDVPDEHMWQDLEHMLAEHPSSWMIWEDVPLEETARRLAAMGVESLVFTTCANAPGEGDWLSVMRRNVAALESAWT